VEKLGPDAMADEVDRERFIELLQGRRGAIKSTLMNQSILAGIGNVYSDEILFQAGIHPETPVDDLNAADLGRLYTTMRRVLRVTTEKQADIDRFPDGYLLPKRDEGVCPKCRGDLQTLKVGGRTTVFCGRCQSRGKK